MHGVRTRVCEEFLERRDPTSSSSPSSSPREFHWPIPFDVPMGIAYYRVPRSRDTISTREIARVTVDMLWTVIFRRHRHSVWQKKYLRIDREMALEKNTVTIATTGGGHRLLRAYYRTFSSCVSECAPITRIYYRTLYYSCRAIIVFLIFRTHIIYSPRYRQ